MDKSTLLKKGFTEIGNSSLMLDVSRERSIRVGAIGTIFETMYLVQISDGSITDIIRIHDRSYDGLLTEKRLDLFLSFFA